MTISWPYRSSRFVLPLAANAGEIIFCIVNLAQHCKQLHPPHSVRAIAYAISIVHRNLTRKHSCNAEASTWQRVTEGASCVSVLIKSKGPRKPLL
jgi:hypothetical protein